MKNSLTVLTENELSNVTGGTSVEKLRDKAILKVCTLAGSVVGLATCTYLVNEANKTQGHIKTFKFYDDDEITLVDETAKKDLVLGQFLGLSAGITSGLYIGKKIIKYLNKK